MKYIILFFILIGQASDEKKEEKTRNPKHADHAFSALVIDRDQPKILVSSTATLDLTTAPVMSTFRVPDMMTVSTVDWDNNKEDCITASETEILDKLSVDLQKISENYFKKKKKK